MRNEQYTHFENAGNNVDRGERGRGKGPALRYLAPAIILAIVLAFALSQAIVISLSQSREQQSFEELRQEAGIGGESQNPEGGRSVGEAAVDGGDSSESETGLAKLKDRNPDFTGWLRIEDTPIDYPVMKPSEDDPEYYLLRDFDGNDSSSGCLFLSAECTADSDAFIIYGHKMSNDTMFGTLDYYADDGFADSHQEIEYATLAGKRRYRVFAAFQSKVYGPGEDGFRYYECMGTLSERDYEKLVETVRAMSVVDVKNAPSYPQQLMFLSTCSYHTEDGRFVVVAYRED